MLNLFLCLVLDGTFKITMVFVLRPLKLFFESQVSNALLSHFFIFIKSAYVKGKSTTTYLLECTHLAHTILSDNSQLDLVYTDLSKAFDKINHWVQF